MSNARQTAEDLLPVFEPLSENEKLRGIMLLLAKLPGFEPGEEDVQVPRISEADVYGSILRLILLRLS